ncbi:hypothetical protein DAQ1742_00054 [Dickeya aquatica]|uniref:Uncharacterized protein n=1 Tax=Dickeya aquatica TaxID=1401087 RepID=A0A375A5D8_9GAMM|nr:hypothetical protein DAQ1742_00054 [Dickeya aquatica]
MHPASVSVACLFSPFSDALYKFYTGINHFYGKFIARGVACFGALAMPAATDGRCCGLCIMICCAAGSFIGGVGLP